MRLSFIWWNTSLSPGGKANKDRTTNEQRIFVGNMVKSFIDDIQADFIALGEVSKIDIDFISRLIPFDEYGLHNGNTPAGRSKFDTCFIYKKLNLLFIENKDIVSKKNRRSFKTAQKLKFLLPNYDYPLYVLISHWPSRLHMKAGDPDRAYLGTNLRRVVEEIIDDYKESATFILMGDYNDEPFDQSMSEHLMATRDRYFATKNSNLLYNPFWKNLSSRSMISNKFNEVTKDGGSFYHKKGENTRWRTFDQIIFSSSFLRETGFQLNEEMTCILNINDHANFILDNREIFDHFPIIGVIDKVE